MIEYFFYSAIFNLIYYFFKLDEFVVKVSLMNLTQAEDTFKHYIDEDSQNKINEIRKTCEDYLSSEDNHNLFTVILDMVIAPIYVCGLVVASIDYYILKRNK